MTDPAPTLIQLVNAATGSAHVPAPPIAPEQLLVSALLESGTYNPRAYGVPAHYIHGLKEVHRFCTDYQEASGQAPPVHLVTARFPSFVFTPGIAPAWAAHEVSMAQTNRTLRLGLSGALKAVGDEAYGEAVGIMRETVSAISTANRPGTLVTDFAGTRDAENRPICPIPPGHLSNLTHGHGAGQLWLIAALWGVGKTFKLVEHSIAAAEAGWDVIFFSLEMHVQDILGRMRAQALQHLGEHALSLSIDAQEALVARWADGTGRVEVRGPDQGRVDASVITGAVAHEHTLVVIDYMSKLYSSDGRHAGIGHEVISLISKEIQQTAGLLNVPILGAAQINRLGQLGGSIALEQDADLILEQKRVSPKVNSIRSNTVVKSRHTGLVPTWFSRFDPSSARFEDISGETAMSMRVAEEATFPF
jgi:hypothetical protein